MGSEVLILRRTDERRSHYLAGENMRFPPVCCHGAEAKYFTCNNKTAWIMHAMIYRCFWSTHSIFLSVPKEKLAEKPKGSGLTRQHKDLLKRTTCVMTFHHDCHGILAASNADATVSLYKC